MFSFAMVKLGKTLRGVVEGHDALCRIKGMDGTPRLEAIPLGSYNRTEVGCPSGYVLNGCRRIPLRRG